MEQDHQQEVIWARYSAIFLPATVNAFLNPPSPPASATEADLIVLKLNNAYLDMLVAVQHTPYFAKYMRSKKPIAAPGKQLPQAISERLVEVGPEFNKYMGNPALEEKFGRPPGYFESCTETAVQVLSTILTFFAKEPDPTATIREETKNALKALLKGWIKQAPGSFLANVSERVWLALDGNPLFLRDANKFRKQMKNWDVCGLPMCEAATGLKVCGRYVTYVLSVIRILIFGKFSAVGPSAMYVLMKTIPKSVY